MDDILTSFVMCQSMFCAIPCPSKRWKENGRDGMLQCLPFVGLELGLIWALIAWLSLLLGVPAFLRGILIGFCPYLTTGSIHLDGFMDVTDAVRSYRSLERRREILKDSHVGSFAVIAIAMVLISSFAAGYGIHRPAPALALILIPVISRSLCVLALLGMEPMNTSQYANRKKEPVYYVLPSVMLGSSLIIGLFCFRKGALALLGEVVVYLIALLKSTRSLEGINGDVTGYCLTLSELAGLIIAVLTMGG